VLECKRIKESIDEPVPDELLLGICFSRHLIGSLPRLELPKANTLDHNANHCGSLESDVVVAAADGGLQTESNPSKTLLGEQLVQGLRDEKLVEAVQQGANGDAVI